MLDFCGVNGGLLFIPERWNYTRLTLSNFVGIFHQNNIKIWRLRIWRVRATKMDGWTDGWSNE